jgi:hypothetical protein
MQLPSRVTGDQDRLAGDVENTEPTGTIQPQLGHPAGTEPAAVKNLIPLLLTLVLIDVHLLRQRRLQASHGRPLPPPDPTSARLVVTDSRVSNYQAKPAIDGLS